MKYVSANEILPERLLREIQQYVQGAAIYVPAPEGRRKKWGQASGQREYLSRRNAEIRQSFRDGVRLEQLSRSYGLAEESLKKIVYKRDP